MLKEGNGQQRYVCAVRLSFGISLIFNHKLTHHVNSTQVTTIAQALHDRILTGLYRPTWDPAQARDIKSGSRQYSTRDIASQTKLKFRFAPFLFQRSHKLTNGDTWIFHLPVNRRRHPPMK